MRPFVAICVPIPNMYNAQLSASWVMAMQNLWFVTGQHCQVQLFFNDAVGYGYARNKLVTMALNPADGHGPADYIFWLDSDVELPPDTILRLMKHNKPIISALYWKRRGDPKPIAYKFEGDKQIPLKHIHKGLMKVDGIGMGACLIKSTVFKEMIDKVPSDVNIFHDRPFEVVKWVNGQMKRKYNWYAVHETTDGDLIGEDIYFCRLIKQYTDLKIWLDPTIETWHVGTAEVHHLGQKHEVNLI